MTRTERGRWLISELIVVVVGVLIALWAEGTVSDLRGRADLHAQLRTLRAELEAAASLLDSRANGLDGEQAALRRLAEVNRGGPVLQPDTMAVLIYRGLMSGLEVRLSFPTLNDLQQSGQVAMIGRPELRTAFADLQQRLSDLETLAEVNQTGPQQELFDPYVVEHFPGAIERLASRVDSAYPRQDLQDTDWPTIRSPQVRGLLAFRMGTGGIMRGAWQRLATRMREIIEEIDAELNESGGAS